MESLDEFSINEVVLRFILFSEFSHTFNSLSFPIRKGDEVANKSLIIIRVALHFKEVIWEKIIYKFWYFIIGHFVCPQHSEYVVCGVCKTQLITNQYMP